MKAEELMIGDWVIDEYTNRPMRIEAVNKMMGSGLLPIPLTAEIFEKNGFENGQFCNEYILDDDNFYIIEVNHSYLYQESDIEINYVHELQHLLRLCGLNELSNNFKI